jgi:hypothetical protein
VEEGIYFIRFGGFAAKTNEKEGSFLAAAGENAIAAWANTSIAQVAL